MNQKSGKSSILGAIAGKLLSVFGKDRLKTGAEELKKADFRTSTQGFGLRFSEKIRSTFRFKWLKKF